MRGESRKLAPAQRSGSAGLLPVTCINSTPKTLDTSIGIEARKKRGIHGLLPPNHEDFDLQTQRCLKQLHSKVSPIEKLVQDNFSLIAPLIYTPTVGEACLKWSELYTQPEGLYLSYSDKGNIENVLQNWPGRVDITVVTDGSRILGLGDLGVNGMGIPVGKLALYTGCAGIRPERALPLMLDLGTNNESLRNDPLYLGSRKKRILEQEEAAYLDELMISLTTVWPDVIVQFEDFKNPFPALERYQHKYSCFNDDIQGTGAVILSGIINGLKQTGKPVKDQRAVFMGAGSAGVGVARQIVEFFVKEGLSEDEARRRFWFVDTKGLITNDRGDKLAQHKIYFSRDDNDGQQFKTLSQVVEYVKPTILMGLSTIRGIFDKSILQRMAQLNEKPIIFPLSNPSNNAECTFEEAVQYTDGRVIFASGSPFEPYAWKEKMLVPSQGNNMYVFPGIGLGSILCKTKHISQEMIYASAVALSTAINASELNEGLLYPHIDRIREVSIVVAREVIRQSQKQGLDRVLKLRDMTDEDLDKYIRERMYDPCRPEEAGGSRDAVDEGGVKAKL